MPKQKLKQGRAVILTALPIEYEAVRVHLSNLREETHPQGTVYECGIFTTDEQYWEVNIVQIETGNAAAALEAERAIAYFEPTLVLFVGVADGLNNVAPGDVVVATKVYGYESGQTQRTFFLPQPDVGQSSFRLIERARAEARKPDWRHRIPDHLTSITSSPCVLLGPIAAGEKVVSSAQTTTFKLLQTTYSDTLGIDMEGRGFLLAAHGNEQVQALIVRGIVDLINTKRTNDTRLLQARAAHHASAFAFEILAKLDLPQTGSSQTQQDLRLVDVYINEDNDNPLLDITLLNTGKRVALPTRARIDILDVGEFYYCDDIDFARSFLVTTQNYTAELSPDLKGKNKVIKIAHQLNPDDTDRFQLVLEQNLHNQNLAYVWYSLKITIIYNEQEYALESMPLLLSVPPVDIIEMSTIWQSTSSVCTQQNKITLHRMAALTGARSASVHAAIQRFLD